MINGLRRVASSGRQERPVQVLEAPHRNRSPRSRPGSGCGGPWEGAWGGHCQPGKATFRLRRVPHVVRLGERVWARPECSGRSLFPPLPRGPRRPTRPAPRASPFPRNKFPLTSSLPRSPKTRTMRQPPAPSRSPGCSAGQGETRACFPRGFARRGAQFARSAGVRRVDASPPRELPNADPRAQSLPPLLAEPPWDSSS
ncbi:Hypothetical predicted protein [Marmota monax]|uniref:Uncharacterized protein n=1 Tax=Marmota monax TaxID=9995 RepID=A0A5E4A2T3_MARMO|nr:hypothetical protein GHT09_007581 [Marmota monax]VTJ51349.1 Hypothetical predicted protein [Marmota monax]